MTTYDVVAMGNKIGMLEIVVNCNTVANIMKDETKANSTVKVRVEMDGVFFIARMYVVCPSLFYILNHPFIVFRQEPRYVKLLTLHSATTREFHF